MLAKIKKKKIKKLWQLGTKGEQMEKTEEHQWEDYLGDGLYASFDGYQIILRAARINAGDHWVALEPTVYKALQDFARRCWAKKETADQ
jgi:hypothetical protein